MSEPFDYARALDLIARKMGEPPRRRGWFQPDWRMKPPYWLTREDDLSALFAAQHRLLSHGRVVWGVLAQANNMLFEITPRTAKLGAPGVLLYSTHEAARADPQAMRPVARQIFRFKAAVYGNEPFDDPEAQRMGSILADEMFRPRNIEVPSQFCSAYPMIMTSFYADRDHLPGRRIAGVVFPVLIDPQAPDMAMIVPHWFWPRAFLQWEWGA